MRWKSALRAKTRESSLWRRARQIHRPHLKLCQLCPSSHRSSIMEQVPVSSTAIRAEEISLILELPNEIIYSILSFACGDGYLLDLATSDPTPIDSPVLTIR